MGKEHANAKTLHTIWDMNTAFEALAYEATAAAFRGGGSSRITAVLCLTRSMICIGRELAKRAGDC